MLNKAIKLAYKAHFHQTDDDGNPYILHPLMVLSILKNITQDEDILCAGVLHDVIEDTEYTYDDISGRFGLRVADLVNEVTHDGKKDSIGYYFPRLKTRDGILIKYADAIANLSRMDSWDEERKAHHLKKSKFWKSNPNE